MMKQAKLLFLLIAALAFASCRPSARQTAADAEQPTDSTEAVTSADTLRLVITDKHLSQTDSLTRRALRLPLDSITVEIGCPHFSFSLMLHTDVSLTARFYELMMASVLAISA